MVALNDMNGDPRTNEDIASELRFQRWKHQQELRKAWVDGAVGGEKGASVGAEKPYDKLGGVEANPEVLLTPEQTILTLMDRPGLQLQSNQVVHKNNAPKPMAMIWIFGGIAAIVLSLYAVVGYKQTKPTVVPISEIMGTPLTATPRDISIFARLDPHAFDATMPAASRFLTLTALANPAVALVATVVVPPTELPSKTPIPTITATPSATQTFTPVPDIQLVIKVFWPKGGWKNAITQSGIDPRNSNGFGLACPATFPLGTVFRLDDGKGTRLVCVDRANLSCIDSYCSVVLYSDNVLGVVSGLYAGTVILPSRLYSSGLPATAAR